MDAVVAPHVKRNVRVSGSDGRAACMASETCLEPLVRIVGHRQVPESLIKLLGDVSFRVLGVCSQYFTDQRSNWQLDCGVQLADVNSVVFLELESTTSFQVPKKFTIEAPGMPCDQLFFQFQSFLRSVSSPTPCYGESPSSSPPDRG